MMGTTRVGRAAIGCALAWWLLGADAARAQPPADGTAVELFDYVVVEGDTCAGLARRFFEDRRRYDILHAYNPSMGPPPHRLVPGTVLRIPRSVPESIADARVTAAERLVTARPEDAESWRAASVGLELFRGWHVSTEERSSAELTFADTSVLALREDTLVIIFGDSSRRVRRGGTEARVERGSLRTSLGALRGGGDPAAGGTGNALRVVTPSAQADMRGGSAVVSVDAAGTSRVSAHEGAVSLSDAGGRGATAVPEGMGSSVATGARPTRPRPLPPAPAFSPGAARFLGAPGRGADVSGSWQPVPGARVYRVEIARNASGRDLLAAVEVPAEVTQFELHGVPAGTYYVRLATIDGDYFESRPGAPLTIEVSEARILGPDGAPLSFPAVDPTEDPAPLLLAPGSRIALPDGVTCSDGGAASAEVAVRSGVSPTCADAAGAPVSLVSYGVPSLEVQLTSPTLERGRSGHVVIGSTDGGPLPPTATLRGRGVVLSNIQYVNGALEADATVPDDSTEPVIEVVAPDGETLLASTPVAVAAPAEEVVAEVAEPVPTEPTPEPTRDLGVSVAAPFASSVSLRNFDARGVGASFAVALVGEGDDGTRVRTAFEAYGTFVDDQMRIALTLPVDPVGREAAPESQRRGSTDMFASIGWIFGSREPLSVLLDLGAWVPTQGSSSVGTVRLVPSLELAFAIGPGFALRTRQSAILELRDGGALRWASAYGMDLRLVGGLSLQAEADLTLGQEALSRSLDVGFATSLSLDLGGLAASIGGRFGPLAGDAFAPMFGPAELHLRISGDIR